MRKKQKSSKMAAEQQASPAPKAPRLTQKRLRSIVQDGFNDPDWVRKIMADGEQAPQSVADLEGMRLCVLASGSDGNCLCVQSGSTVVLVDAGITPARLTQGLTQIGIEPKAIRGLLLTHNHSDHWESAALALHQQYGTPLYANEGTAEAVDQRIGAGKIMWQIFETGAQLTIGNLAIVPFEVLHDAAEPVGFIIDDGQRRLGIATDLGMVTETVRRSLAKCDALVLETNHDVEMLRHSDRPRTLIRRIEGCRGYLSNEEAATVLTKVLAPRLKTVVLSHLSRECNTPALAIAAVKQALAQAGRKDVRVEVAGAGPTGFIEIAGMEQVKQRCGYACIGIQKLPAGDGRLH